MKKILKISQYLCFCTAIFLGTANRADAFLPMPPMPWSLEVDLPGNVGKVFSEGQALALQYKTIKSQLNTVSLKTISGKLFAATTKAKKDDKTAKNPGKGIATGDIAGTKLDKDTNSEEDYFNAYNKLFFLLPDKTYGVEEKYGKEGYQIIETAYRNKSIEYQQDVIVDTYFTGLLTERYLKLVEKTLNRLEECQNSIKSGNCTFFGLEMVEIPSMDNPQEQGEDNPGILAQMKNAYIVSTVYDRLMRIVEDLTATEAIYRAATQMKLATPVKLNESNAEKYIPQIYNFASRNINERVYAKSSILNTKKQSDCFKNGGEGCPGYNKEKAQLENMKNAEIMKNIDEIETHLNEAIEWHNMKVQLPKYKTKYRQYLIAKEIHENTLNALINSEKCAETFWNSYKVKEPEYVWGTTKNYNDHENREVGSLSRWLVNKYEQRTMNKIIGSDEDCNGFYEHCPMGYRLDESNYCKVVDENGVVIRERKDLHPCTVDTIAEDMDEIEKEAELDDSGSNYLKDATGIDNINLGSRIAQETPWQIGSELLMKLVKEKQMEFEPWNDQKSFQEDYLRQKYRNMELIVKSIDTAVNSYQIAASKANGVNLQYEEEDKKTIQRLSEKSEMIDAIAYCAPLSEAKERARGEFCVGSNGYETEVSCTVYADSNTGKITANRKIIYIDLNGEKQEREYERSWNQVVSLNKNCDFKNEGYERKELDIGSNDTNQCTSSGWDLSVGYLVKSYYNKFLGNCAGTPKDNAIAMYNKANEKGRIVAQDKLYKVIETRVSENNETQEFISEHEEKINKLKKKITEIQKQINGQNEENDKAAIKKNMAQKALTLAKQRIESIEQERKMLNERQAKNSDENRCAIDYKLMKLDYEKSQIEQDNLQWRCPDSCKKAAVLTQMCNKGAENYLISLATFEAMQDNGDNPGKFVAIKESEAAIEEQKGIIKINKEKREILKKEITDIEEEIKDKNDDFADEYINRANSSQEKIEAVNKEFEDFMEEKLGEETKKRMENSEKPTKCKRKPPLIGKKVCQNTKYSENDLETTITQIFEDNSNLKEVVKSQIKDEIIGNRLSEILQNDFDIPAQFVIDNTFTKFGITATGAYTSLEVVEEVVDKIVDAAAGIVTAQIKEADKKIKKAQEDAVEKIEAVRTELGVCENCTKAINLSSQKIYKDKVVPMHNDLIKDLKQIADKTEISNIFGIPEDVLETDEETGENKLRADEEYFVALPARGYDYKGKDDYEKSLNGSDENAGRDYYAPKEPLINLPPVREVFYYSANDYDDTPKYKRNPVIPYLLNKKYQSIEDPYARDWEYMPEIWRYLLARPNLRADRKYQQTFGERSLESARLEQILKNGSNDNYNTIIARGGTYPCKIGEKIYDVIGNNDDVQKIEFVYTSVNPFGNRIQKCYDIKPYYEKPCSKYSKHKRAAICHLLSGHGPKEENKAEEYVDSQEMKNSKNLSMFANYSELGLLLQEDLKYRPMQQNVNEYLKDAEKTENNINRQKAEHASFTHNVFGSFLEMVNAEYNARKNLEKLEEEMKSSLSDVCDMIHKQKDKAGNPMVLKGENGKSTCTDILLKNFVKSVEDKVYGEKEEYSKDVYNGIDCKKSEQDNYYQELFCLMDENKNKKLATATTAFRSLNGYSGEDRNLVYEYITDIMKEMAILAVDNLEITMITPDINIDDIQIKDMYDLEKVNKVIYEKVKDNAYGNNGEIQTAKIDRDVDIENDDLAISAMENQSQVVPYCPFYIYKENKGL